MSEDQTKITYVVTVVFLILAILASLSLEGKHRDLLLEEGGIVETASAFGYFWCLAFILKKGAFYYVRRYHYFVLLIAFFGFRELDFDKRFTTMGILKLKFYLSSQVPVAEKIAGIIVISLLVYTILFILYRHLTSFWTGLKRFSVVSIGSLITIILLAASKILDGVSRKLAGIGMAIEHQTAIHLAAAEELLELGIPIILISTFSAYFSGLENDKSKAGIKSHNPT